MGDSIKRFLRAAHLYWQFLDEANRMPELPPPWVCPLQCWWPRSEREPKMESAAYWPDAEGDRHRARGPSIDDLERLAEEAGREAGVWEHSSPDVRKKIRTLLEMTIALPLDYDMKAYPAAVDIWFEEYRELKPYRDEPMPTAPATVITAPKRSTDTKTDALYEVFSIYTDGSSDDRFKEMARIVSNDDLTLDEKLWAIHKLIPIPSSVSAEKLGKAFGVTKAAIQKTSWYLECRKGEQTKEFSRRRGNHVERGKERKDLPRKTGTQYKSEDWDK